MLNDTHIAGYRDTINRLVTLAHQDVKTVLGQLETTTNPIEARDTFVAVLPGLVEPYSSAAGMVAAEWYALLRDLARPSVPYAPEPVTVDIGEKAESLARYATGGLFDMDSRGRSEISMFGRVAGGVQRLIANHGRASIHANMTRDPAATRWARVAAPGCCAFCWMLAGRGAVYTSQQSATGRASTGLSLGPVREFMRGFHNNCACVALPLHDGQRLSLHTEHV